MENSLIDENKQVHSDAIELMFDKAITSRYKTIRDYCDEKKYKLEPNDLKVFIRTIEKTIYDHIFYYAHLMYHYMEAN